MPNTYGATLPDPRRRVARAADGSAAPTEGAPTWYNPATTPGATPVQPDNYLFGNPEGTAPNPNAFESPTAVQTPGERNRMDQFRYWGLGFGPGGVFSAPAPQSDFVAQALPVNYEAIPQAQGMQVAGSSVSVPWHDSSQRYAQDYQAALGAGAATAAERQRMQAVATGQAGPSLAELQLRQGQETAAANAMGAALTGRGGAGVQIAAMRQGAGASMLANQQAAQQRAAEQLAANQQVAGLLGQEQTAAAALGGLTASQGGLEQGWQGQYLQAQQGNQANALAAQQANAENVLAAQQANQQAYLEAMGIEAGTYEAALAANAGVAQANLDAETAQRERSRDTTKSILQGIGGAMMFSDETLKTRVEVLDAENADLRAALEAAATGRGTKVDAMRAARASEFQYRPEAYQGTLGDWEGWRTMGPDEPRRSYQPNGRGLPGRPAPAAAPGERMVGVMAQDVAQGDPGMVSTDPASGKLAVDTGQLASAAAAGSSTALKRQDEVEARLDSLEAELRAALAGQEQAAFDDRFRAYQNAEQWSGVTPTPSNGPAPWLSGYMGAL